MTTLRETLAAAIFTTWTLGGDYNREKRALRNRFRTLADAVLRVLATWEPSDAVTDAMWHAYNGHEHAGDLVYTLTAALRAMAEEDGT